MLINRTEVAGGEASEASHMQLGVINIYVFVSHQDQSVDQSEFLRYIFEDMDM